MLPYWGGGTEEVIPVASDTLLGCVSIGDGLSIDENGKLSANLSGMTKEFLLWENSSPTSSFAVQTIEVDTSPYDYILIDFYLKDRRAIKTSDKRFQLLDTGLINSAAVVACRYVTRTTDGVVFEAGNYYTSSGWTTNNTLLIPERIIGIKILE